MKRTVNYLVQIKCVLASIMLWTFILVCESARCSEMAVLWNRLDSATNVQNSDRGPGGTIVGSNYAFEPAQFGNGYVRKAVGEYLSFPGTILTNLVSRGTIEMWINPKVSSPQPYDYGVFNFVGAAYEHYGVPSSDIEILWGDGMTGQGFFGHILFGGTCVSTNLEPSQFYATPGVPFHVAMSWDIGGIDSTADTIRVYRDGVMVTTGSGTWNPDAIPTRNITLGYGADWDGKDKFITDNIKIWDHAVTDFQHRFEETYVPEPATLLLLGLGGMMLRKRRV